MPDEEPVANFRKYVESLNSDNPDGQLKIVGVDIVGTGFLQTRQGLLAAHARPLLQARKANAIVDAVVNVQRSLQQLGVFDTVEVTLDKVARGEVLARISIPAAKRFVAKTGTNFGNNESSGYIKGTSRNYFGLGETLSLDSSIGTRTKSALLFSALMPLADPLPIGWMSELTAYSSDREAEWASYYARVKGLSTQVMNGCHTIGLEAVLRTLRAAKLHSGNTVSKQAGNAAKLNLFYSYTHDTRDIPFLPSKGHLLKVAVETATGDYPYAKACVLAQQGIPIVRRMTANIGFRLGALVPLGRESYLMDRFFLGGPLDVRGFRLNRLGPGEQGDTIGGDLMAAAGISLFHPITKSDNLKLHIFGNAGGVRLFDGPLIQTFGKVLMSPSCSGGFGLVLNHPAARLELNLVMPLIAHPGDGLYKGLQFGVGLSYL